jgi:hypothetical protein
MISELEFIKNPDNWPNWPMLPLKKPGSAFTDQNGIAVLVEDREVKGQIRFRLYIGQNIYDFSPRGEHSIVTPEDVVRAGWKID